VGTISRHGGKEWGGKDPEVRVLFFFSGGARVKNRVRPGRGKKGERKKNKHKSEVAGATGSRGPFEGGEGGKRRGKRNSGRKRKGAGTGPQGGTTSRKTEREKEKNEDRTEEGGGPPWLHPRKKGEGRKD